MSGGDTAFAPPPRDTTVQRKARARDMINPIIEDTDPPRPSRHQRPERDRDFNASGRVIPEWNGPEARPPRKYGSKAPVDMKSPYRQRDYSGVSVAQELGYHDTSKYWQK